MKNDKWTICWNNAENDDGETSGGWDEFDTSDDINNFAETLVLECDVDEDDIRIYPPKAGKLAIPYDKIEDYEKRMIQFIKRKYYGFKRFIRQRGYDKSLLFTDKNTCVINNHIGYNHLGAYLYLKVTFDPEKKFGIKLHGGDDFNVYAYLPYNCNDVEITYAIYRSDGNTEGEKIDNGLTQDEKVFIREIAEKASIKETGRVSVRIMVVSALYGSKRRNVVQSVK